MPRGSDRTPLESNASNARTLNAFIPFFIWLNLLMFDWINLKIPLRAPLKCHMGKEFGRWR